MPASTPARSGSAPTKTKAEPVARPAEQQAVDPPSDRLVAQRGLFHGPNPVCPDGLYLELVRGTAVRHRRTLTMGTHTSVSTDTYFGRFPASYWQRWTTADQVELSMTVTGSGRVSVIASDVDGLTRAVAAEVVVDAVAETLRFPVRLDTFLDGGFLWLDIATEDTELTVEQVDWTVEAPSRERRTSVVICTFNRADDCVATLTSLAADQDALALLDAVYVVDQGSDLVESRAGFAGVQTGLDGRLRYLRQANLGGAGGFSRGMYEVVEVNQAENAGILLMDDDVLCDPEIVVRMTAFANRATVPTIVGGQMLRLLHPTTLIASAEYADFDQLVPGKPVAGGLDDVDLLAGELDENGQPTGRRVRGDARVDADYNAWWSCLIPSEAIGKLGYPLPLFFQWDDVEYGYRAKAAGIPTVTLPGAGLWHADFDWKDGDKWGEYFAVRNAMIVSALHGRLDPVRTARVIVSRNLRYLLTMQYGLAATILTAAEDFLDGPGILADGGAAAAVAIRTIRAEYPDTTVHPANALTSDLRLIPAGEQPSGVRLLLAKRLLGLMLGRSSNTVGTVSKEDATWWHVSQFDTAIVTDASQEGVRYRKRDREVSIRLARRTAKLVRRLLADAPRVREEYRAAVPQLTTRENWARLYGLREGSR